MWELLGKGRISEKTLIWRNTSTLTWFYGINLCRPVTSIALLGFEVRTAPWAECGWRRVLGFRKAAEDLSGADDPCKSIPCLRGRKGSVTHAMNDKLKIKIALQI